MSYGEDKLLNFTTSRPRSSSGYKPARIKNCIDEELKACENGSRMRSKGSGFTLGVWELMVCSLDVVFTATTVQTPSNVRNHSCRGRLAVPMVSSAKGHFWRLHTSHGFVSQGRRGISCHSDMFYSASEPLCMAGGVPVIRRCLAFLTECGVWKRVWSVKCGVLIVDCKV